MPIIAPITRSGFPHQRLGLLGSGRSGPAVVDIALVFVVGEFVMAPA
jgi:hypothetical protein